MIEAALPKNWNVPLVPTDDALLSVFLPPGKE